MSAAENFSPRIHGPFCSEASSRSKTCVALPHAAVLAGTTILVKIWISAGSMKLGEKNSHCRYFARNVSEMTGANAATSIDLTLRISHPNRAVALLPEVVGNHAVKPRRNKCARSLFESRA